MSMFETFEAFADIDQLVEKLDDSDSAVRQIAVLELSESGDPAALPHLIGALQDPDAEGLQAAKGLEEYDEPDAATALAAALADEKTDVAEAAAYRPFRIQKP